MNYRALGRGESDGGKIVRLTYLDEAGISSPQQEPILTVGGVIVHADRQSVALEKHFDELKLRFLPPELHHLRDGFVFHTYEIWHGTPGTTFDRKIYKGDRREVLRALRDTIVQFQLPIVFGSQKRDDPQLIPPDEPSPMPNDITAMAFASAFFVCLWETEQWMHEYAKDEVTAIVCESNKQLYKKAKNVLQNVKGPKPDFLAHVNEFPFRKIIDTVYTADKVDAPALQLADFCAFMLKRFVSGKRDSHEYMRPLIPHCVQLGFDLVRPNVLG